jgi:pimeloyl-ACP methyl ester carboxylesterase
MNVFRKEQAMTQTTNGHIPVEDGKIYYEIAGAGEPMVFVHAGIVDSRMWDDQWEEFSQCNTVIRYDMRGFGKSSAPKAPVSRRQELYGVLKELGITCATLVGCSFGGETILDVALERPDMISGLIVVSTVPGGFEMQGDPPQYLREMLAALQNGDHELASELRMRISMDGPFRKPGQLDQQLRRRAAEMNRMAIANDSYRFTFEPLPDELDPPAVKRLHEIKAPTLIIAGELDHPEIMRAAGVMSEGIPWAEQLIIPGTAHLPNMEKPAEFNQVIREFLTVTEKVRC